jgi:MoxR-like ATPase
LAEATRSSPDVRLGASPRATLQLLRAAKAWAAYDGRDHVLPDDMQQLLVSVLAHRMILTSEAHVNRRTPQDVLARVLNATPVPERGEVAASAPGSTVSGAR